MMDDDAVDGAHNTTEQASPEGMRMSSDFENDHYTLLQADAPGHAHEHVLLIDHRNEETTTDEDDDEDEEREDQRDRMDEGSDLEHASIFTCIYEIPKLLRCNGKLVFTKYAEHECELLDLGTGESTSIPITAPGQCSVAHGLIAVSSFRHEAVYLVDVEQVDSVRRVDSEVKMFTLRFLRTKPWLACGGQHGIVNVIDVSSRNHPKIIRKYRHHFDSIYQVAISTDDTNLFAASADGTASIISLIDESAPPIILRGHRDAVMHIVPFPDGQTCITGSTDKSIKLWDVKSGICKATLVDHECETECLAIHPNGHIFAVGSFSDNRIVVWDVNTLTPTHIISSTNLVNTLIFMEHINIIIAGTYGVGLVAYDLNTGMKASAPFGGACENDLFGLQFGKLIAGHSDKVDSVVGSRCRVSLAMIQSEIIPPSKA